MIYPNPNSGGRGICWRMKWTYEFWGFCINGGTSVTVPNGFAVNGINLPINFTDGTSLMASGTDGAHTAVSGDLFSGDCVFTSASATFTTSMVGKALVIWKPNSGSSEDSIYVITQVLNATQLMFNANTGGTPNPTTKHPSMNARTGVNYRVVDMVAGANAGYKNGMFMVLQIDEADTINPGQDNSQIFFNQQAETHANTSNYGDGASAWQGVGLSGTGSWDGTPLSITAVSGAGVSPIQITTAVPHGLVTGQTVAIYGVAGNTNCNGTFLVTVTGPTTVNLTGGLSGGTFPTSLGTTTGNGGFGTTTNFGTFSLPISQFNVVSTAGFDVSGGTLIVQSSNGPQTVTYTTVVNSITFGGCSGGTGTVVNGNSVNRPDSTLYKGFANDGYTGIFGLNPNTSQAYTAGQTAITMIGDKTFLINHMREQDLFQFNLYYWFHWEIPQRLYPQGVDRNPIAFMWNADNAGGVFTSSSTAGYGGGFVMRTHSSDISPIRGYKTLVKAIRGDGTPDVFGQNLSDYRIGYNTVAGTIPITDALLGLPDIANQYQFARCRLRTVKFTGTHVPKHHRLGLNGDFMQVNNGVCWPWDNTIHTSQLLLFGI